MLIDADNASWFEKDEFEKLVELYLIHHQGTFQAENFSFHLG